jgi:DNA segregation ATPase FtsK/SpoIIIE-like protein
MTQARAWVAVLLIIVLPAMPARAAENHWLEDFLAAKGGCANAHVWFGPSSVPFLTTKVQVDRGNINVELFGKPLLKWTDDDIATVGRIYRGCLAKLHARPDSFAAGQARYVEPHLHDLIDKARNLNKQRHEQQEAQLEVKKAQAQRQREQAEEEAQRKQEQLREQARVDRQAAEEARRLAEREEPKIAEATKEAEDARRAREAAERRLAEIRSRIDAEEKARKQALGQMYAAEAARQREIERQAELEEDARLSHKCKVSFEQFQNARLGMSLREVERLFGCKGGEVSSTQLGRFGVVTTYSWDGKAEPSNVTATFRDSILQSKMQFGLE